MVELSEIERLRIDTQNQVNYMVSKFQEAINLHNANKAMVDKNIADYICLDNTVNDHVSYIKSILSKFDEHKSNFEYLAHKVEINRVSGEEKNLESLKKFELLNIVNNNFIIELSDHLGKLLSIDKRLESSNEALSLFDTRLEAIKGDISFVNGKINDLQYKIECLDKLDKENKSNIICAFTRLDEIEKRNKDLESLISKSKEEAVANHVLATKSIKDHFDALNDTLSKKIDSIVIPSIQGLAKSDEVVRVANQLESISLDAKNAFLKSSNNDMQLLMMSKKVESVLLAIKNFELTK